MKEFAFNSTFMHANELSREREGESNKVLSRLMPFWINLHFSSRRAEPNIGNTESYSRSCTEPLVDMLHALEQTGQLGITSTITKFKYAYILRNYSNPR